MSTIVDTLATRFTLDDSDYKRGASSIVASTAKIRSAFVFQQQQREHEVVTIKDNTNKILAQERLREASMSVLSGAFRAMTVAASVASAAVIGIFGYAMKQAGDFDRMSATFAGAFGSMEAGVETMKALESYAMKSSFSLDALTQSATGLAASGLSISRFLPLAEKFALVVGGTDPQGLEQVIGAFARIKGGSFGEAMEVFRRAGIGANDLRGQGIQMTKGGEIQSTSEELFRAIERLSQGRISNMAKAVEGSDAVTQSNLADNMGSAWRALGDVLNDEFLPILTEVTKGIKQFAQSGGIKAMLAGFGAIGTSANDIAATITNAGRIWVGVSGFLSTIVSASVANIQALFEGRFGDIRVNGLALFGEAYSNADAAMGRYDASIAEELGKPAERAAKLPGESNIAPEKPVEKAIERNTREMVSLQQKQYDLQRLVFGSGVAGRGVIAENLSDSRKGRSRRSGGPDLYRKLGILIAEMVEQEIYTTG
jgi:hypothetical protein